jgi:transcriptional regulator with XRE-family HTH domain
MTKLPISRLTLNRRYKKCSKQEQRTDAIIKMKELLKALKISQRELSDRLQVVGLDIDKNAVQRIESGQRFVTDIEILAIAKCFNVTIHNFLNIN